VLSFRTKIYHPNVTNDERGAMCLGMLKSEEWKPPNKIREVLAMVRATLGVPNPDDAVETGIAEQVKQDYASYEKVAKEWVARYAK
jgi:ubiquitin-conjugating enzyme E2 D/E